MNILVWYWGRLGGGAKFSEELAKELINLESENVYLSFSKQSDIFDNIKTLSDRAFHINTYNNKIQFILKSLCLPILIIRFIVFIKKNNIKYVLTTMPHVWTVVFLPFLKIFGIKHFVVIHDASSHPGDFAYSNIFNQYLINHSYKVIVLSKHVRSELLRLYHIESSKIILSAHGMLNYENLNISEKLFDQHHELRIIFFGRIEKYKGLEFLLKAQIEIEQQSDHIKLEIYGSGNLDKYSDLIKSIRNIKLENRWIDDKEIYAIFDKPCINVAPYIEASQSGTIPVALSCGIPTICSDVGALSEQIIDSKTGIVIDHQDLTKNLVSSIRYLDKNRMLLNSMSKAALSYASSKLNWENICKELLSDISKRY